VRPQADDIRRPPPEGVEQSSQATFAQEIRRFQQPGLVTGLFEEKPLQAIKHSPTWAIACRGVKARSSQMPKMKTKSGAKKRFRVRPGGTVKRGQAFKRHILTKKSTKNKRHLRGAVNVHETNMGHIAQMLPFAGL
jgi:large subunit ribosomal protein L35